MTDESAQGEAPQKCDFPDCTSDADPTCRTLDQTKHFCKHHFHQIAKIQLGGAHPSQDAPKKPFTMRDVNEYLDGGSTPSLPAQDAQIPSPSTESVSSGYVWLTRGDQTSALGATLKQHGWKPANAACTLWTDPVNGKQYTVGAACNIIKSREPQPPAHQPQTMCSADIGKFPPLRFICRHGDFAEPCKDCKGTVTNCGSTPSPDPPQNGEVLEGLRYIADSPAHEHGGFHPEAVKTAKNAISEIERLREALRERELERDSYKFLRDCTRLALGRVLHNFELLLAQKPVRDADETISEARAALAPSLPAQDANWTAAELKSFAELANGPQPAPTEHIVRAMNGGRGEFAESEQNKADTSAGDRGQKVVADGLTAPLLRNERPSELSGGSTPSLPTKEKEGL